MRTIFLFISVLLLVGMNALAQNFGVGTNIPIARLHVKGAASSSTTNNLILQNSNNDTLFRVRNDGRVGLNYNGISYGRSINIGGNGINIYHTDAVFAGAIFPTDTSLVIWSDDGDNKYVILQPSWGKVGIGTYYPKAKFHVRNGSSGAAPAPDAIAVFESELDVSISLLTPNSASSAIYFGSPANSNHGGIVYNSAVGNGLDFRTNGNVTRVVINGAGNVGIADNSPSARLSIKGLDGTINSHIRLEDNNSSDFASLFYTGDLVFRNSRAGGDFYFKDDGGANVLSLFSSGNMTIAGSLTQNSDLRLKENIQPLNNALEKLLHLKGCNYYWKPGLKKDPARQTGFIAQEVEIIMPELVRTDAEGMKSINYIGILPYIVEAFKEQQNTISSQQTKLDAQQLKIEALEKQMEELKAILLQLQSSN